MIGSPFARCGRLEFEIHFWKGGCTCIAVFKAFHADISHLSRLELFCFGNIQQAMQANLGFEKLPLTLNPQPTCLSQR